MYPHRSKRLAGSVRSIRGSEQKQGALSLLSALLGQCTRCHRVAIYSCFHCSKAVVARYPWQESGEDSLVFRNRYYSTYHRPR